MVVGDDDQSIYRFRGASFAAFAEFDARFSRPPTHDPTATPPGLPPRLRIEQNFRSVGHVLTGANRLITSNETRFEADKRLSTDRQDGAPIELLVCAGPEDEAVAIVDVIQALTPRGPVIAGRTSPSCTASTSTARRSWRGCATRTSRTRSSVGCPCSRRPRSATSSRASGPIANPHDDVALVRMMTAGPWRLDALEILRVTRMANFDRGQLLEAVKKIVDEGRVEVDQVARPAEGAPTSRSSCRRGMRAKLRQLLGALDELNPLTLREGPFTILERYLERTGQVLDLSRPTRSRPKRTVTNIASFMRFAADWQAANPSGTLGDFVGVPRRVPGGRRRAADERGAVRGRRRRAADDPVPGEGPRVPDRVRPEPARRRVADEGAWAAASSRASCCARPCRRATSTPTRSGGSCTWR